MKQLILVVSVCLLSVLSSCSDEELPGGLSKESAEGKRSVTFAISKDDEGSLDVTTRAKGSVVTDDYAVVFYLFAKNAKSQYVLIRKENVTTPLYTIENLDEEGSYKYVFVATTLANASALNAIDFSSVKMDPNDFSITLPATLATPNAATLLENCYFGYVDDISKKIPGYGTDSSPAPETIPVGRDLQIFGCGALIVPGMTYNTPVNVVMERQFGVVEFRFTDAQPGDKLTCSFSSEYYRLYLSQLVRTTANWNYSSDNYAVFPSGVFENSGLAPYSQGDYYSASGIFKSGFGILPIFTKDKVLGAGENSVQVYVPYTTAQAVGTAVADIYKANYVRTNFTNISGMQTMGPKGGITLTVTRGGAVYKTYTQPQTPFPIYQNGKTIFTTVGSDYLQVYFGPASATSNDGIQLDPDGWHGE